MVRKSPAKAKPIKVAGSEKFAKKPELPPIEETFDMAKTSFVRTAEVAVLVAGRVDNLVNIRKAAYDFWGSEIECKYTMADRMKYYKKLQAMTVGCYENIIDIVNSFELDEFLKEEMKDYFEVIMPKVDDIETEDDLFQAYLLSGIIKPWGEKMSQLHYLMLDDQKARQEVDHETV